MSFKDFIPTIWSARLLANQDATLTALQFVNRDYEGEIAAFGDTVKINQVGDIAIKKYDGTDIDAPEELSSTQQTLTIDQARYFNFQVKDLDKAQANVSLIDQSMARAAYAMASEVDADIYGLVAGAGVKVGSENAPIVITPANAYDELVKLGVTLSENNVPKVARMIALPSWYLGMLSRDARFTKDLNILKTGVVDGVTVGGFTLVEANTLAKTGEVYHSMAKGADAIQFANQVVETEGYRPEKNFADAVKGLNVWGRKVTRPENLVDFVITSGDPTTAGETPAEG